MLHPQAGVVGESDLLCCLTVRSQPTALVLLAYTHLKLHASIIEFPFVVRSLQACQLSPPALYRSCRLPESLGLFQALPQALSRPQIHRQNDGPAPS